MLRFGLSPEEAKKYASVNWQYGPRWMRENVRWSEEEEDRPDGSQQQS